MSAVKPTDILFRTGGVTLLRYGRPFIGYRRDGSEPESFTFTRADSTTCATFVDADLAIRTAAAGKLRCSWYDTDSDGVADVCGLLLESSRANICLQSEDFSTTWSAGGTPTRSGGAATCGCVSLDLIGDDSAAALEYYAQDVTFTGDAVKAFSVIVVRGTSTSSVFRMIDSAASVKLLATLTWNGNVPSLAMTTGTHLRTVALASTTYRLEFQTASVTAANPVTIQVFPATTAALATANTGNLYCGAVMAENAPYPSSYIKTTTGAVTRAADALSFPIGFAPEDLTVYAKIVKGAWDAVATVDIGGVPGGLVGGTDGRLEIIHDWSSGSGKYYAIIGGGGTSTTSPTVTVTNAATPTVVVQILNAPSAAQCRIDGGGGFGSYSAVLGASMTTWTTNVVTMAAASVNEGLLVDFIVLRGSFTLAEAAATPTP